MGHAEMIQGSERSGQSWPCLARHLCLPSFDVVSVSPEKIPSITLEVLHEGGFMQHMQMTPPIPSMMGPRMTKMILLVKVPIVKAAVFLKSLDISTFYPQTFLKLNFLFWKNCRFTSS